MCKLATVLCNQNTNNCNNCLGVHYSYFDRYNLHIVIHIIEAEAFKADLSKSNLNLYWVRYTYSLIGKRTIYDNEVIKMRLTMDKFRFC